MPHIGLLVWVVLLWAIGLLGSLTTSEQVASVDLVIAIPTVPRLRLLESETPYLLTSLEVWNKTLHGQINKEFAVSVRIVVVSHESPDDTFERARGLYGEKFHFIAHEELKQTLNESESDRERCFNHRANQEEEVRPVMKHVQKQALDLARTMKMVSSRFFSAPFFMLIEDDFMPCEGFVSRMASIIDKSNERFGNWLSVRLSYGFTGVLLNNGPDVDRVADYIKHHRSRRPPDHLLVEFLAGETEESREYKQDRPHLAYRYNLFEHIGKASTLRIRRDDSPRLDCLAPLVTPILFAVETCSHYFGDEDICSPGSHITPLEPSLQL